MNEPRPDLLTSLLREVSRSFYLTLRLLPNPVRPQIGLAYHHARATVLEMAGAYPQALESMRFPGVFRITQSDIERVEGKLAESLAN